MECEEIERTFPSSFRLVPHNVSGIPATLWLTMWTECEEFVSLNETKLFSSSSFVDAFLKDISPLHVGISLRSALKGTLSGSLSVTLADESWKSPLIEDKKYN